MTHKERIDVFISSTSYDLPEHRQAVIEALGMLKLQPVGMEYWAVTGEDPVALCKRQVEASDAFIGIYAHRYGWCPPGYDGKSITELEYDWWEKVERDGKPVPPFCFVMHDDHPITVGIVEQDQAAALAAFKSRVKERHVGFFKSVEDLKAQVVAALAVWLNERGAVMAGDRATATKASHTVGGSDKNRQLMLRQVHEFWIEGVLERAKLGDAWLDVPAEERPEAVEPLIERRLNDSASKPFPLTADTNIGDVFRTTGRTLLILGAPGAGKTIALLELAKDLIEKAERDSKLPMPVVLNLASWAGEQPERLEDWLIERLNRDYGVTRKAGERWIADGDLLFLLDGLDEVAEAHRDACVTAINAFWSRAGDWVDNGIVVCSRTEEYDMLTARLRVQMAIQLQPLTLEQAQAYVTSLGEGWSGLSNALAADTVLQALATSPLLLNIMAVAYYRTAPQEITGFARPEDQQKQLFDRYVARRLRDEESPPDYPHERTRHYLAWLARQMKAHRQSLFQIEGLQPDWLDDRRKHQAATLYFLFRLVVGPVFGLVIGLVVGARFGLVVGLAVGLVFGLLVGLRFTLFRSQNSRIFLVDRLHLSWGRGIGTIVRGLGALRIYELVFTLFAALVFALFVGQVVSPIFGLFVFALVSTVFLGLFGALESETVDLRSQPNQGVWQSLRNGLIFCLVGGLVGMPVGGPIFGLIGGLAGGLVGGLLSGLRFGMTPVIHHAILRHVLWRSGDAPLNYAAFLRYATSRHLTRQVGGGFVFRHRLLLEHFADSNW